MIAFRIDDMNCGHCASTITEAVRAKDAHATVETDLSRRLLRVHAGTLDTQALTNVIKESGYTPVPVQTIVSAAESAKRTGCGCGCACKSA